MAISCSNVNRNTRIQCENFNGIFLSIFTKEKRAFSLLNAWVWHKKKEPPFYLGLRLLEMFIAISETIARPENNAKKAVLQGANYKERI